MAIQQAISVDDDAATLALRALVQALARRQARIDATKITAANDNKRTQQ